MRKNLIMRLLPLFLIFICCSERMNRAGTEAASAIPEEAVYSLENTDDLNVLMEAVGNSRIVLLGEATHGTAEFYTWRAKISRRLIQEKGFDIIAVEADWSDAGPLNNYIKGSESFSSAEMALQNFDRWPGWMWNNEEIAEFAEWLKNYNSSVENSKKVSFRGMDVYGIRESLQAVHEYLQTYNPAAASYSKAVLDCFAPYEQNDTAYAAATVSSQENCADEVTLMFDALEATVNEQHPNSEVGFNALQNAIVVSNAEAYYRTAAKSNAASWNVRDLHMTGTVERLLENEEDKVIIWAHNTHVGDARATDMLDAGIVNVGQLLRENFEEDDVYIIGFGTYTGKVIAAEFWEGRPQVMRIPKARRKSWEALLHQYSAEDKIILMDSLSQLPKFQERIGHRAIGVVYDPAQESGNYVPTVLPKRYDAFIFIDKTTALEPLE